MKVIFDAGVNGVLEGESSIEVPKGHILSAEEIPVIKANKGFVFTQWTPGVNAPIDNDTFSLPNTSKNLFNVSSPQVSMEHCMEIKLSKNHWELLL